MSDIAAMVREMQAQMAPASSRPLSGFPVSENAKPEQQAFDNKHFSGVSGVSGSKKNRTEFDEDIRPPARAGERERAGARGGIAGKPEMPEMPEMPTGRGGYLSGSLSSNPEKKKETGNPPGLRALLTLASDPDRQLAFDERAAFLEYECGLSRAEAEATAANEILPELPAQPQATVSQPEAAPGRNSFSPDAAGQLLRSWHAGLATLSPTQAPCRDYRGNDWTRVYNDALAFLDTFGAQAEALGWQTSELWGVHPTHGTLRVDHCGALVLGSGPVRAITADAVYFASGAYRRTPGHQPGIPVWEARR